MLFAEWTSIRLPLRSRASGYCWLPCGRLGSRGCGTRRRFGSAWLRGFTAARALAGNRRLSATLVGEDPLAHVYEVEDKDELRRLLGRRYHAVVGNPPYISRQTRDGCVVP